MLTLRRLIFGSPPVECPEESLYLTQEQGYGYYPASPGQKLKDGNHEIIRKLGRGRYSSTWLVSYQKNDQRAYRAVKILTAKATELNRKGILQELEVLQSMMKAHRPADLDHVPRLRDHFYTTGPHGEHLCLVLDVLSTDVHMFRLSAPKKSLALHIVQKITSDVVDALVFLHAKNIIHTDLKADNILFKSTQNASLIEREIAAAPLNVQGHVDLGGASYPIILSQPISHGFHWDDNGTRVELAQFCLSDLGHAQWSDKPPSTDLLTPFALRAPEVILRAGFDDKVDIWALGCIVFELLTGRWLFDPSAGRAWNIVDDHLAKMQEITGETFSTDLLGRAAEANKYFDDSGKLLRRSKLCPVPIEKALSVYEVLDPDDIEPAAAFIRACVRLDPKERATAAELQNHDWIAGAEWCRDYPATKRWAAEVGLT